MSDDSDVDCLIRREMGQRQIPGLGLAVVGNRPVLLARMLTPHPSRSGREGRNHFTMGLG